MEFFYKNIKIKLDYIKNFTINNFFIILFCASILLLLFGVAFFNMRLNINITNGEAVASDYNSYYYAAKHALAGDNLYFSWAQKIKFTPEFIDRYVYPPLLAYIFIPFSLLNFNFSFLIYIIFTIFLFIASIYLLSASSFLKNTRFKFFFSIIGLFLFSPILWLHIARGQTDIIILFLLTLCFFYYTAGNKYLAGISVGIAALLKLTPLIFIAYFLFKDIKIFFSSCLTIIIFSFLIGIDKIADFFKTLYSFANGYSAGAMNNGLLGLIYNKYTASYYSFSTAKIIYFFLLSFLIYFFISLVLKIKKYNRKSQESDKVIIFEFAILVILMIIIPTVSWLYNGVYIIFALSAYWGIRYKNIDKKNFFTDGLFFLILSSPLLFPLKSNPTFSGLFALRPFYLLLLLIIFTIYYKKLSLSYEKIS
jgi:hypothetical protein